MVARLWWKEARQIWPIWAFLAAVGLAAQGLAAWYLGKDLDAAWLGAIAFGTTFLYAFLIGAAAIAGETENRTLALLDALPVERWRVWTAKSSFAIATTAVLGIVLWLGVPLTSGFRFSIPWVRTVAAGLFLLSGVGWGLFWSSFSSNALLAATLAIVSVCVSASFLDLSDYSDRYDPMSLSGIAGRGHAVLAIATLLASAAVFLLSGPPKRTWSGFAGRRPATPRVVDAPAAETVDGRRRIAAWPYSASRIAWQAYREVRPVWQAIVAAGVILPALLHLGLGFESAALLWFVCGPVAAIVAGVSVFNGDNRGRTHRFLAQHGARPGVVWGVKTLIWLAAIWVIWFGFGVVLVVFVVPRTQSLVMGLPKAEALAMFGGGLTIAFAIATLCGMVFRRGITACTIAVVLWFATLAPTIILTNMRMITPLQFGWAAFAILAVSWGWSGQWLLDRPGVRRWVSLGLLSLGSLLAIVSVHAADRVWSVPSQSDVEREFVFHHQKLKIEAVDGRNQNAADLYRRALTVYKPPADGDENRHLWADGRLGAMRAPIVSGHKDWVRQNEPVLAILRQAALKPLCRYTDITKATFFSTYGDVRPHATFDKLLIASARVRLGEGDLKGAWTEIDTLFRMGRQLAGAAPMIESYYAQYYEEAALSLAMKWAADERQTVATLRDARGAFHQLPLMLDAAEVIRAEALILQNTLDLPRGELRDGVAQFLAEPRQTSEPYQAITAELLTTPWELARTRRVLDVLLTSKIHDAQRDPSQPIEKPKGGDWSDFMLSPGYWNERLVTSAEQKALLESTPLARGALSGGIDGYIDRWNRIGVARLALDQIFRLRIWQAQHDGLLPETLLFAIDDDIPKWPIDPYSPGRAPFGYVVSVGQFLPPLGDLNPTSWAPSKLTAEHLQGTEGCWLLYSVGPDRIDQRAMVSEWLGNEEGDIVFPLKNNVKPPTDAK